MEFFVTFFAVMAFGLLWKKVATGLVTYGNTPNKRLQRHVEKKRALAATMTRGEEATLRRAGTMLKAELREQREADWDQKFRALNREGAHGSVIR